MGQDISEGARRQSGLSEAEAKLLLARAGQTLFTPNRFEPFFTLSERRCANPHSSCSW
jgi:hypothetical protein